MQIPTEHPEQMWRRGGGEEEAQQQDGEKGLCIHRLLQQGGDRTENGKSAA